MVSAALVKLSLPLAKSFLIGLGVALSIDATFTIYASTQYPFLIDAYNDDLYISSSRTIAIAYSTISSLAILVSVSTFVACYKNTTNYVLIHAGLTGVFLPATILVYFTAMSARYKASDYTDSYYQFISDYRISKSSLSRQNLTQISGPGHQQQTAGSSTPLPPTLKSLSSIKSNKTRLSSFTNNIDSLQRKFSCCGVESAQDWVSQWHNYIPPSCCASSFSKVDAEWQQIFQLDEDQELRYCTLQSSYTLGCLVALKEDEHSKYAALSDLLLFMIVVIVANTIVSLLMFGFSKTEDGTFEDTELAMVGVSDKPRPSRPAITSIRPRPSVVHTLDGDTLRSISSKAQSVRFQIATPQTFSKGPLPKFSKAARRGSSFL